MSKKTSKREPKQAVVALTGYDEVLTGIVELLETARRASARTVNAVMTATYSETGRRIVETEIGGTGRAEYGTELLKRSGADLTERLGRGFSWRNLYQMRVFYLTYPEILQTPSAKSKTPLKQGVAAKLQTSSAKSLAHSMTAAGQPGCGTGVGVIADHQAIRQTFLL